MVATRTDCLRSDFAVQVEHDSNTQLKLAQKVMKGLTKLGSAMPEQ